MSKCQHGQLARVCQLCEYEARIRELEVEVERLQHCMNTKYWDQIRRDNAKLKKRAEAAEAKLAAIEGLPRFGVHLTGFWMRQTKGPWIKYTDIDDILRGESEDSGDE